MSQTRLLSLVRLRVLRAVGKASFESNLCSECVPPQGEGLVFIYYANAIPNTIAIIQEIWPTEMQIENGYSTN